MTSRRLHCAALAAAALAAASGCRSLRYAEGRSEAMRRRPDAAVPTGLYRMVFDDFNSLNTDTLERSSIAYKVMVAALLLDARRHGEPRLPLTERAFADLATRRYGFLQPRRIANWPRGAAQPRLTRPLGLVTGTIQKGFPAVELEAVNTGCSTCHAATLYDATGAPTGEAWIGLPSSSINLEAYSRDIFRAFRAASGRQGELVAAIRTVFPSVSERELDTIRDHYLPPMADRVGKLARTIGAFHPYSNGGPGVTNGVATVQLYFRILGTDRLHPEQIAYATIPELGGLREKRSILVDGVYAPEGWAHYGKVDQPLGVRIGAMAGVAAMVTIGTLGVTPEVAARNAAAVRDVVRFLFVQYESPRFPGAIDAALAARGEQVFAASCQRCHGRYARAGDRYRLVEFPNRQVSLAAIGTDPARAEAVKVGVTEMFDRTAMGPLMDARAAKGYVAQPLTAVWATAPYLHNGSVPTLYHLLHPAERPARFQVGGHRLDFARLGVALEEGEGGVWRYPAGYRPWSAPEEYDTADRGHSNRGHMFAADLPEEDRRAVLEFVKQL
jgi:mono/diheme cytochrome c family protein